MDEAVQPAPPAQQPNEPAGPGEGPDRRGFVIVAVLALVVIAGIIAWSIGRRDAGDAIARDEERFPSPTTVAPPTTEPPPTTVVLPGVDRAAGHHPGDAATDRAADDPARDTGADRGTHGPTDRRADDDDRRRAAGDAAARRRHHDAAATDRSRHHRAAGAEPRRLRPVPDDAGAGQGAQIDQLLATGRHDVAAPGPVATICAAVRMDVPLAVNSRWKRDGRRIASSDLGRRDAPGFGECLGNDGDPLDDGSYQYVAIDSEGHESAAGGIVVGAVRLDQVFTNNTSAPVCAILVLRHRPSAATSRSTSTRRHRSRPAARSPCRSPTSARTSRRSVAACG